MPSAPSNHVAPPDGAVPFRGHCDPLLGGLSLPMSMLLIAFTLVVGVVVVFASLIAYVTRGAWAFCFPRHVNRLA